MSKAKDIFREKYLNNSWKGSESKSGPGSSLPINKNLIFLLENFVKENKLKTISDYGCGDFNWMRTFNFDLVDNYYGYDIVEEMIDVNNEKFGDKKIKFRTANIIEDQLEKTDIILCKDVLFHLSFDDAIMVLEKIKKSGSIYLISTTFLEFNNYDIKTGNWRPINLQSNPFNMNNPEIIWENIENRNDSYSNKSIAIWKIN